MGETGKREKEGEGEKLRRPRTTNNVNPSREKIPFSRLSLFRSAARRDSSTVKGKILHGRILPLSLSLLFSHLPSLFPESAPFFLCCALKASVGGLANIAHYKDHGVLQLRRRCVVDRNKSESTLSFQTIAKLYDETVLFCEKRRRSFRTRRFLRTAGEHTPRISLARVWRRQAVDLRVEEQGRRTEERSSRGEMERSR